MVLQVGNSLWFEDFVSKLQYVVRILISCSVFVEYTNSDGWNMFQTV